MAKRLTVEEFIKKARKVHGNKYDYSKVIYINSQTEICIICPFHGEFWITPNSHLRGHGCKKCSYEEISLKNRKPFSKFLEEANLIHKGKYIYDENTYKNDATRLRVICPTHGEFWQTPHDHLDGCGCKKCKPKKFSTEDFIKRSKEIHGETTYIYTDTEYVDYYTRLCIICPTHGKFWITPSNHLRGKKKGCPYCTKIISSLEDEIKGLLAENHIDYVPQYREKWLGYQSLDFYLPKYNIAIECQGKQHFGQGGWSKDFDFEGLKKLDEKKYNLCAEHNIKLLYFSNLIPNYKYFDKVYTNKNELLETIRYLYTNNNDLKNN